MSALTCESARYRVVAGKNAGSKLAKAQELGVPVITEEQFESLIK